MPDAVSPCLRTLSRVGLQLGATCRNRFNVLGASLVCKAFNARRILRQRRAGNRSCVGYVAPRRRKRTVRCATGNGDPFEPNRRTKKRVDQRLGIARNKATRSPRRRRCEEIFSRKARIVLARFSKNDTIIQNWGPTRRCHSRALCFLRRTETRKEHEEQPHLVPMHGCVGGKMLASSLSCFCGDEPVELRPQPDCRQGDRP